MHFNEKPLNDLPRRNYMHIIAKISINGYQF